MQLMHQAGLERLLLDLLTKNGMTEPVVGAQPIRMHNFGALQSLYAFQ
jgi:hypothetical protein